MCVFSGLALCFSVIFSLGAVRGKAKAAETYEEYICALNRYLLNGSDGSVDLSALCDAFQGVQGQKCSTELWLYTKVMMALAEENYSEATNCAIILEYYAGEGQPFRALLQDENFKQQYPGIRPVDDIMNYINGRMEEQKNNNTKASEHYAKCLKFFDADARYEKLNENLAALYEKGLQYMRNQNFVEALENAQELKNKGYSKGESLYNEAKAQAERKQTTAPTQNSSVPGTPAPAKTPNPIRTFQAQGDSDQYTVYIKWDIGKENRFCLNSKSDSF